MTPFMGTRGSTTFSEKCAERASNSGVIARAKRQDWGDEENPEMTKFGRFGTYLQRTAAGGGSDKLRRGIGFTYVENWQDPKFTNAGIEEGHAIYIEGGFFDKIVKKFRMFPSDKEKAKLGNALFLVGTLERKTSCSFIPHPDNPDRPRDPDWASKKHVYFMKGFTADADVRVTDTGKSFLKRCSAAETSKENVSCGATTRQHLTN